MSYRYFDTSESQSPQRPTNEYADDMDEMAETSSFVREMLEGEDMPFATNQFNSTRSDRMRHSMPHTNRSLVINEPSDKYVPVRNVDFPKKKGAVRESFSSHRVNDEKSRIPREFFHKDMTYDTSRSQPGKYREKPSLDTYEHTSTRHFQEDNRQRRSIRHEIPSFQSPITPHEAPPPTTVGISSIPGSFEPKVSRRRTIPRTAGNRDCYKNEPCTVVGLKQTPGVSSSSIRYIKTCRLCNHEFGNDKRSCLIRCPHCGKVQPNGTCNTRTIIPKKELQISEKECCIFRKKYLTAPNHQTSDTAGMDSESISYVEKYFREDSSRVCRGCYQFYGHKYGGNR